MAGEKGFGKFRFVSGKAAQGEESTMVPLRFLQSLRQFPIPITISATSQRVFTINAGVTNPVYLWNGNDFMPLVETLAYTWNGTTNNVLNASTGAATTLSNPAASTVYYMYAGMNAAGTYSIRASTAPPSYVQGPFDGFRVSHPGTAKTQFWNYVGFMAATATTPTFEAMTKIGYTYMMAATSKATATTWAELDFSHAVPKHGALGVTVGGHLETGADGVVTIGSTSSATLGVTKASSVSATLTSLLTAPLSNIVPTANGKVYANHTTAAGDVHISQIVDIV